MSKEVSNVGVSFPGLLTILFIGLKLGGVITWSWWWVLSPIWIPLAIILTIMIVGLIVIGIMSAINK